MIDMTSLRESRVYVEPNYRFLCPDVEYQSHTVTDFSVLEVRGELMLKLGEQTVYVEMSENLAGSEMVEILRQGKEVEAWTACTGGVGYVVGWQMGCALRRAVGVGMGCATWRYFCSGRSDAGLVGEREVKAHRQGYQWKDECRYCKRRTESATGRGEAVVSLRDGYGGRCI
jgi:hypothetical protein